MRAVWRATASCQQRLAWAAAAFVVLCVSEWRIWTSAQSVAASADTMGSDLVLGLLGLVLVQLLALGVFGYATRRWSLAAPGRLDWQNGEGWLVLGIVAVGCVLRLAALQEVPAGLWFDTAESGNQALRILNDPGYRPVFIAGSTQLPALFVYFDALAIHWLGAEALAVRLPGALFGVAAIPAVWWLGRQLGGPVLGLAAAFALATSRWEIDFSRLAIASSVTPFAVALALAAAVAALRTRSQRQRVLLAIASGLAVSLGLWCYPASALIVVALAAGLVGWVVHGGRLVLRSRLIRAGLVGGVALGMALITLTPLIGVAVLRPDAVLQRSATVAVSGPTAAHDVVESSLQHVLMFTVLGDRNGRHNTPGRPELGWFGPFFLAGIGAALWRRGSGVSLALPATLLFLAAGILTLTFEAPQSHRSLMAVVPGSLLIGLPVALAWSRHRGLALGLTGLLVIAGTVESADYFHAQLQDDRVFQENSLLETDAGRWLKTLGPNVPVLAAERFRSHPTVRYLSGDHPSIAQPGTAVSEFLPLDASVSAAVLASAAERALFDRARTLYPQAPIQTFGAPLGQGEPRLWTMFVSQPLQAETTGFLAQDDDGNTVPVKALDNSTARVWSATMRVLRSGTYTVASTGASVAIDGQTVLRAPMEAVDLFLARGAHGVFASRADADLQVVPTLSVSLKRTAPPGGTDAALDGPDPLFFALPPPGGLLFTWQIVGRPQQALVDSAPHRGFEGTFNDGRPWTAQWRGMVRAPAAGEYGFRIEVISTASLTIDDQPVVDVKSSGGSGEGRTTLMAGWHTIRVDYADQDPYAHLILEWRPPGERGFGPLADHLLRPTLALP